MLRWVLLLVPAVLAVGPVASAQTPADENVIIAQGEASLTVAPDRAWVQIAAEARGQKPDVAQQGSADAMTAVRTALARLDLSGDAIRTTGYSLESEWDYANGRRVFRDYVARNQIDVRVDDITRVSGVIDAAGTSGATSVAGLRFDLKDQSSVEQRVLRLAVEDALARAQAMAAGAHRTLGAIVRIQEQRGPTPRPMMQLQSGVGGGRGTTSTPVSPGEVEIRSQVTVTVRIQ
jgi:uncharacterized protein